MRKNLLGYIIVFLVGIFALFMGAGIYWSLQPDDILTVSNNPVSVRPLEVVNDGAVNLTIKYCKNHRATGKVEVRLVGSTTKVDIPWPTDTTDAGCHTIEVPVRIPAQTPTDTYRFTFNILYNVNPLKSAIPESFQSQKFHVTNTTLDENTIKIP